MKRTLEKPPGYGSYGKGLAGSAAQRILLGGGVGGRDFMMWMHPGQYRKLGMRDIVDGIEDEVKKYLHTTLDFYKERDSEYFASEIVRQRDILKEFINNMKDEVFRFENRIKTLKMNIEDYEKAIQDSPTATRSERLSLQEWKEELQKLESDLPYAPMFMDMVKRVIKWMDKEFKDVPSSSDKQDDGQDDIERVMRLLGK